MCDFRGICDHRYMHSKEYYIKIVMENETYICQGQYRCNISQIKVRSTATLTIENVKHMINKGC